MWYLSRDDWWGFTVFVWGLLQLSTLMLRCSYRIISYCFHCIFLFSGGITSSSAIDYAYSYTFLHSVICLSSVCHIPATCLNRSADIPVDAVWQVHLWGLLTHCVGWDLGPPWERGDMVGANPQPKHAVTNCMLPPGEYKRGVGWTGPAIPPCSKLRWSFSSLLPWWEDICRYETTLWLSGQCGSTA